MEFNVPIELNKRFDSIILKRLKLLNMYLSKFKIKYRYTYSKVNNYKIIFCTYAEFFTST